ncbi:MAG: putative monooxygenase [Caulobacteraceae bacterium]|nr:putative monooxygenase [Caulobacteraceae bacterium]
MSEKLLAAEKLGLRFDPEALRQKYLAERDRRIRADHDDQYIKIAGEYASYLNDPYAEEIVQRAPLFDDINVLVVGGGFGGLMAGARLREAGVKDIRLVEKGSDFGGTWYWNRYPGAACDVEAYTYLPMLEETGYIPSEKYTGAQEIWEHAQRIGRHYNLYENALFQTGVTGMTWDEAAARWIVRTDRGDELKAKYVILAGGETHSPKLPGVPGIRDFEGHSFHTMRWDYNYTGGGANGELEALKDKRVGIIGTGATAVQCIPPLGASAKHLFVFQRTPSGVDVRDNHKTDPEWVKKLKPGWHQRRMRNFAIAVEGGQPEEDLDSAGGFTDLSVRMAELRAQVDRLGLDLPQNDIMELANMQYMEGIRRRADEIVRDRATAEALKAYYAFGCKRPCWNDDYLETFNRANVTLVDTHGKGVERITKSGVVANGKEYELDCIIFASGFQAGSTTFQLAGFDIEGRGGEKLEEHWKDGYRTLHGICINNFPNFFILSLVQTGYLGNSLHVIGETAKHLAYIIGDTEKAQAKTVEASKEGEDAWVQTMVDSHVDATGVAARFKAAAECTPGYYNNEGRPTEKKGIFANIYGGGGFTFIEMLANWRAEGKMKGLELRA